ARDLRRAGRRLRPGPSEEHGPPPHPEPVRPRGGVSTLRHLGAKGFRPFFMLAGVFAVAVVPVWVWSFTGGPTPQGALQGVTWHAHEMIFGFTVAVIAGLLLTAVENWTGRPTLRGPSLLAVAGIWAAARGALWWPGWVGPGLDLLV